MKKLLSLFLSLCIFSCCSITALAADTSETITVKPTDVLTIPTSHVLQPIMPRGNGGDAPPITKIELDSYGWLKDSGNFGIILKVTGYGNDNGRAYFNNQKITSERLDYFINSGFTADGWYWLYDCGPITEPGTYPFKTTFRSTNPPYNNLTFSTSFTFEAQ